MSLYFSENKPAIYLASDLHLGVPDAKTSLQREKHFIAWLDSVESSAAGLILLGDIFDFWFEYKKVIPKGFVRIQGRLAEWKDKGIPVYIFSGNHDLWMKDYFLKEMGIPVFHQPMEVNLKGHVCWLAHGDGLGPGDQGFKVMKKIFKNPGAQFLFSWLHPDLGIPLAEYLSGSSRKAHVNKDAIHYGKKEFLYQYALEMSERMPHIQKFIFGHRHRMESIKLPSGAELINLGDWLQANSFLEVRAEGMWLKQYPLSHE